MLWSLQPFVAPKPTPRFNSNEGTGTGNGNGTAAVDPAPVKRTFSLRKIENNSDNGQVTADPVKRNDDDKDVTQVSVNQPFSFQLLKRRWIEVVQSNSNWSNS